MAFILHSQWKLSFQDNIFSPQFILIGFNYFFTKLKWKNVRNK